DRRSAKYERPADDDLAMLVVRHLEDKLDSTSAALSAALAIVKHEESAPQREAEKNEMRRRLEMDRKRHYEEACRRGDHGPAEQDRAVREAIEAQKRFHGPSGGASLGKGTSAHSEIQIWRRNAGLRD